MIRSKSFLQMFSCNAVGGGSLDFHLDTHSIIDKTDYGKSLEAQRESEKGSISSYKDSEDNYHYYQGGCYMAHNGYCPNDCTPDKE